MSQVSTPTQLTRALLSVTDKTGVVEFARELAALGIELISTGGTARVLREAGLAVRDVAELTGFPEMLDGRVKTIHPRVAAGVLAIRGNAEHMQAIAEHNLPLIDMVVVNLYDFASVAAKADAPVEELIENIDIGGPTMIRAAAKNWQDVAVVVSPADYAGLAEELKTTGALARETHWRLMLKAFELTAQYDGAISARLAQVGHQAEPLPATLDVHLPRAMPLRYGENPHQHAALYAKGQAGVAGARQLQGKELSYNNLVDLDAAWQLIQEFAAPSESPACAIIKHTNPCGLGQATTLAEAYQRALEADPTSAFGGVLAFNRIVDSETAAEVTKIFTEAIAAPAYTPGAIEIFQAKKNLRILEVDAAEPGLVLKSISGGVLVQTTDTHTFQRAECKVATQRQPTEAEWRAMEFAWHAVKHVKSNAIVYARATVGGAQLISAGSGQTSRVDSAKFGAAKAVLPMAGCVVASDAFFPFADGLEVAASNGATAAIQPGGSVKDAEVIAAADRLGMAMVFTGVRHFRH
jgi:phosphoribosylaminoimidazolecarboxamide formyltransferase / IMP cyclohydrolase